MDILLIAVIFIIILAIAALFGLRHLQAKKGELPKKPGLDKYLKVRKSEPVAPVTSTAITEALENIEAPEPIVSSITPPVAPEPANELSGIDAHMRNQNYDDAIHELKRILMINPHHNEAMLKLLQVYGITKRYNTFNQLHQKIQDVADEKTVAEANFLKALIDDEIAGENTQVTKNSSIVEFDKIDFSLDTSKNKSDTTAPANQATSVQKNDSEVNFTAPIQSSSTLDTDVADDDFDLLLDEPITLTAPVANSTQQQSKPSQSIDIDDTVQVTQPSIAKNTFDNQKHSNQTTEMGNIFDLSNPRTFDDTVASKDDTTFDLGDFDILSDKPNQPQKTIVEPTPTQSADDFAFDFDETPKTTTADSSISLDLDKTNSDKTEFDGLDFDFDLDTAENTKTDAIQKNSAPNIKDVAGPDNDFGFDFGDLLLDEKPKTIDANQDVSKDKFQQITIDDEQAKSNLENDIITVDADKSPDNDFDFGDLTFDFGDSNDNKDVPTQETKANTEKDEFAFDFDDLSLEDTPKADETPIMEPDSVQPTQSRVLSVSVVSSQDNVNNQTVLDDKPTAEPYVREIPVTIVTHTTPDSELSNELDFVNQFDNSQITLNLAKHYLKLGEYDAAKRLLNEVAKTGDGNQQQHAQELIARLG